jgi:hypothetical protein
MKEKKQKQQMAKKDLLVTILPLGPKTTQNNMIPILATLKLSCTMRFHEAHHDTLLFSCITN